MSDLNMLPEQAGWGVDMHGTLTRFCNNAEKDAGFYPGATTPIFTADQMRAYAAQRVAAECEQLRAENRELSRLLARYRDETPLGNQPHMIAHQADEALGKGPNAPGARELQD